MCVYSSYFVIIAVLIGTVSAGDFDLVNFRFVYGKSPSIHQKFYLNETSKLLRHEKFISSRKTVFYTHGWTEGFESKSVQTIARAYIQRNEFNFISVDWGAYSTGEYFYVIIPRLIKIGHILGRVYNKLFTLGLDINLVHLVGHSFGAHMSGIAGRTLKTNSFGAYKFKRITGLDAAGPGFYPPLFAQPLNPNDAEFVDVIHTDTFLVGTSKQTGTVDFWVNKGVQPACPPLTNVIRYPEIRKNFCSHELACMYWAETVANLNRDSFPAFKCRNWADFRKSKCKTNPIYMGIDVDKEARGNYYLETNAVMPYSKASTNRAIGRRFNQNRDYKEVKALIDIVLNLKQAFLQGLGRKKLKRIFNIKW